MRSRVYSDLDVVEDGGDLASQKSRRYVHAADGQLVAWWDNTGGAGEWHFVHADMLGTTRLVTDDAGNVGSGLAYTAFGELAGSAFPGGPAASSRYGYCGGWGYEDDTLATLGGGSDPVAGLGLLHVGARWYASGGGRFLQRDPVSVFAGPNTYAYGLNAPTAIVDPSGYWGLVNVGFAGTVVNFLHSQVGFRLAGAAVWLGTHPSLQQIIPLSDKWAPRISVSIPVPWPHLVPGAGDPRVVNCLFTAIHAIGRGWGIPW